MTNIHIFIIAVILLLVVTILILLLSYLINYRHSNSFSIVRSQINKFIIKEQLTEIDVAKKLNQISDEDYQNNAIEIKQRVLDEIDEIDKPIKPTKTQSLSINVTLSLIIGLIIISSSGLYFYFGNPKSINFNPKTLSTEKQDQILQFEKLLNLLQEKIQQNPENEQLRILLARSYKSIGNLNKAIEVFATIEKQLPQAFDRNAELLAEYADTLATKNQSFKGKTQQLITKALTLDPQNLLALWLAGTSEFSSNNYESALKHWHKIRELIPPESEDYVMIQKAIEDTKKQLELSTSTD